MKEWISIGGEKFFLNPFDKEEIRDFEVRPGGWIIFFDHHQKRKFQLLKKQKKWYISYNGRLWFGEWGKTEELSHLNSVSHQEIKAQFPGKVRQIFIETGACVKKGDSLLLLEAMKMEFVIKSQIDAKVKQIFVAQGNFVAQGDELIKLEK